MTVIWRVDDYLWAEVYVGFFSHADQRMHPWHVLFSRRR